MRNVKISSKILSIAENLPIFSIENLGVSSIRKEYTRILLSRRVKRGDLIRLKKGLYTSKKFITEAKIKGKYSVFLEFLSSAIYSPSYLSTEYILHQHNILTEVPVNFTLITRNKT